MVELPAHFIASAERAVRRLEAEGYTAAEIAIELNEGGGLPRLGIYARAEGAKIVFDVLDK